MSCTFDDIGVKARVIGGLLRFPEVRAHARDSGIAVGSLFDHPALRELALAALNERQPRVETAMADQLKFYVTIAHIFAPDDPAWAIDMFRLLVAARRQKSLPATLRWAADALEQRWDTPGRVLAAVTAALEEAAA